MIPNNCPTCGTSLYTSGYCPNGCKIKMSYIVGNEINSRISDHGDLLAIIADELETIRELLQRLVDDK